MEELLRSGGGRYSLSEADACPGGGFADGTVQDMIDPVEGSSG